jgi:RHS repeat-associated protein
MQRFPSAQIYTYDQLGRPVTMEWAAGTTSYQYEDTHTGSLSELNAPDGTRFRWYFDRWGRDTLQTVGTSAQPNRITERRVYDLVGQPIHRYRRSQAFPGDGGILMDSLSYDHRGKIREVWTSSRRLSTESYSIRYDGLGAVVASLRNSYPNYHIEEFRNDAYGNVLYSRTRSSASGDHLTSLSSYMGKGQLYQRWTPTLPGTPPSGVKYDELSQMYDGNNLTSSATNTRDANTLDWTSYTGSRHYYDGENRLAMVQRYSGFPAAYDPVTGWYWSADGTFEEYRYDALGRRVMTQVRRTGAPASGKSALCEVYYSPTKCRSYVEHTLWAGDQMLEESRTPIGDSDASNSGTVRYVHGPGIDRPLAVLAGQTHIVNYTWRGLGESSLTPTGEAGDCSLGGGTGCTPIDWPINRGVYFTKHYASSGPPTTYTWMGTLTANGGSGTTGLLYRRNRYYDSETGRWTQEDPIGIAGGINVYGFAAGDPVNYTDPFGLCAESSGGSDTTTVEICQEQADLPGNNDLLDIQHMWLRTSEMERGLGTADGGRPGEGDYVYKNNLPFWTQTAIVNETGRGNKPTATCRPVANVSATCVNRLMQLGSHRGRFQPVPGGHNCQTVAQTVITRCKLHPVRADVTRVSRPQPPRP